MKKILLILALTASWQASAAVSRVLDGATITNGAATITVPTTTDTLVGRATTDTLTNKSISGATNTFTSIPASAVSSGTLAVANGGTGNSTLTQNGIVYGNGTSAAGVTSAGSQYQVYQAGSGGTPTVGAVALNQSAAVSGALSAANGGTGQSSLTASNLLVGNGTGAVSFIAPGTAGYVLTSNGSSFSSQPLSSAAPSLNGTSGAAQSVTAGTGVSLSSITYDNIVWVAGNAGPVTVTATPSITAGTQNGQRLIVIGTHNTNTVTLQDEAGLSGSDLRLNGTWVGSQYSVLELVWDSVASEWHEIARR